MSVWVMEGVMRRVMRRGLHLGGRGSLRPQRCFPSQVKDSSFPSPNRLALIRSARPSRTCPAAGLVRSMRFYSRDGDHGEDLEEKEHLSSPAVESSLPTEIQTETASMQRYLSDSDLQGCGTPSDVLDLVGNCALTAGKINRCLSRMWTVTKEMSAEQRRYELQLMFEHPALEILLQKAMTSVGDMFNEDIAFGLISMVQLGVPQRSRVVQTFLRACQEKLNDFDIKGLSVIAHSLALMEKTPNVAALKAGVRLVVEARFPTFKNAMAVRIMFCLLGKDTPPNLRRKLETEALSVTDQFSLVDTLTMIKSMARVNFYSKPLLDICSKKIRENLDGVPFNGLLNILRSFKELEYRDVDLLADISYNVASTIDMWTTKQLIQLLSKSYGLMYCPAAVMEGFATRVIVDPNALTLRDILFILRVYSSLNYDLQQQRQPFLDSLSHALDRYLPTMSLSDLLNAVYRLCLLGHFPPAPLQRLLQSSTLEQLKTTEPELLPKREKCLQTVDLCLRLERPPLPVALTVPPSLLGDSFPRRLRANPRLLTMLRTLVEEHPGTTLQESVLVENFYHIDGVITKPLASQPSVSEASSRAGEEGSPAESSQRIAVIASSNSFCYGTTNPCGFLAVKIRHLKILGFHPVLAVNLSLSEQTKKDFLRRQIFPELHTSDA